MMGKNCVIVLSLSKRALILCSSTHPVQPTPDRIIALLDLMFHAGMIGKIEGRYEALAEAED